MSCCGYVFCVKISDVATSQSEQKYRLNDASIQNSAVVENTGVVANESGGNVDAQKLNEKLREENEQKDALVTQLTAVEGEISELREKIQNEEIERDMLQAELNAIESSEKAGLSEKIEIEKNIIQTYEEHLRVLQSENEELKRRIAEEETDKRRLQGQIPIPQNEEEFSKLRGNIQGEENEKARLQQELDTLQCELQELKTQLRIQGQEREKLQERSTHMKSEVNALSKRVHAQEEEERKLKEKEETSKGAKNDSLSRRYGLQDKGNDESKEKPAEKDKYDTLGIPSDGMFQVPIRRKNTITDKQESVSGKEELDKEDRKKENTLNHDEGTDDKDISKKDNSEKQEYVSGKEEQHKEDTTKNNTLKQDEGTDDKDTSKKDNSEFKQADPFELPILDFDMDVDKIMESAYQKTHKTPATPDDGLLSEMELEKIAQSTYRYSYHQFVENYKDGEDEDIE